MNISGIKKNVFWIVIGGGIIFVIVCYFTIANPLRLENVQQREKIEDILTRLERYGGKGDKNLNEKWLEAEQARLEALKEAQREYELFYRERDNCLEKIFDSDYGEEIKDEALWKSRYIQSTGGCIERLEKQNISLSESALPFKKWEKAIPAWEAIIPEQKRFRITEELINILLKGELKVISLESINFETGGDVVAGACTELYDIIPVTIKVTMNVGSLLLFINEMLKSKIPFEIKTVDIKGQLNRIRLSKTSSSGQPLQKRGIQSSSIVDVDIGAYVPDLK